MGVVSGQSVGQWSPTLKASLIPASETAVVGSLQLTARSTVRAVHGIAEHPQLPTSRRLHACASVILAVAQCARWIKTRVRRKTEIGDDAIQTTNARDCCSWVRRVGGCIC